MVPSINAVSNVALATETVSPKAALLPPLPAQEPLTSAQWKTLLAIADAVIPAVKPMTTASTQNELGAPHNEYATAVGKLREAMIESDPDAEKGSQDYLEDHASMSSTFKLELQRTFSIYMLVDQRKRLLMILNVLDTRAGSLALTGYLMPMSEQPLHIREAALQDWATARLGALRQLQRSLTIITNKQTWMKTSPTLRRVLGMPRVPTGMAPSKGFDYEFIQFLSVDLPEAIETDVVVIGSGCGGGVCAKNSAEAGHRVLVTEKAYHWTPDHLPMTEVDGLRHLYTNGGVMQSDNGSPSVLAGQARG